MAKESEAAGTIESIVLVTIPAALIYFTGWAYLYYYLRAFSIDPSELEFDVETVLMYAAPPIFALCSAHSAAAGIILVGLVVCSLLLYWLTHRRHKTSSAAAAVPAAPHAVLQASGFVLKGLWALAATVIVATLLRPALRDIAIAKAQDNWKSAAVAIQAPVEEPQKGDPLAGLYENYKTCLLSRHLRMVFSDRDRYFILCIAKNNAATGALYEVRREDSALTSVRYITRPTK